MQILHCIEFNLNFTSPYNYIKPFFEYFPWLNKLKKLLPMVIDLAISFPKSSAYSAEDLFFGCFRAAVNIKQCQLNDLQKKVLEAQITNQATVQTIAAFVEGYFNSGVGNPTPDCAQENSIQECQNSSQWFQFIDF